MKNLIVILIFLISGLAMAQTTVTLEEQCNCEVLNGTEVTAAGMTTPPGADIGDIYVNTDTGTIYFWNGGSWELTSKAARIFYPPSIAVDASTTGTNRTINLYTQYTAQFTTPAVASAGAPAAIPTYAAGDLYYYVTFYDTSVFDNLSVGANGVMTYDVIAQPADYNSLINVVFVVK